MMSALVLPNVSARSVTVRETVKKSKASQVHARKATEKNSHCCVLSIAKSLNGLATLFICGFKVVMRVARYLPAPIFSGDPPVAGKPFS